MCRFDYGLQTWKYGREADVNNDIFRNKDFDHFAFFGQNLSGIIADLKLNYTRFILNKVIILIDQFLMNVWYKDKNGGYVAEPNLNKYYVRYRWVDGKKTPGLPPLHARSSETVRDKQFKCTRPFRIKKTIYPRCKEAAKTSDDNLRFCFADMLTVMNSPVSDMVPRLLLGWGPYVGVATGEITEIISMSYRLRYYGVFTFSGKIMDSNVSSALPDTQVLVMPWGESEPTVVKVINGKSNDIK